MELMMKTTLTWTGEDLEADSARYDASDRWQFSKPYTACLLQEG